MKIFKQKYMKIISNVIMGEQERVKKHFVFIITITSYSTK